MKYLAGVATILLVLALAQPASLADQNEKLQQCPWGAFPLGSYVIFDATEEKDGEITEETIRKRSVYQTTKIFSPSLDITRLEDDSWLYTERFRVSSFYNEIDAMEIVEEETGEITIDGKTMETTIRTYHHTQDYRFSKYKEEITIKAIFIDEPIALYRLIGIHSTRYLLPPDCVAVELIYKRIYEEEADKENVIRNARSRIVETGREVVINGEIIQCVVEELEGTSGPLDGRPEEHFQIERLLSENIPGRIVMEDKTTESEDIRTRRVERLSAYRIADPIPEFDPDNLPPLEERPVIPAGDWGGMRLGAWKLTVAINEYNYDDIRGVSRHVNFHLDRVIAIDEEEGVFITSFNNIKMPDAIKMISLHDPSLRTFSRYEEKTKLDDIEIIVIDGMEIQCKVVMEKNADGLRERTTWIPIDKELELMLSRAGKVTLKREEIVYELHNEERVISSREMGYVTRLEDIIEVDGRRIPVIIENNDIMYLFDEEERKSVFGKIYSGNVPGRILAENHIFSSLTSNRISAVVAWGEAERPVPADIDSSVFEITDRIGGFSNHYIEWYAFPPGTEVNIYYFDETEAGHRSEYRSFRLEHLDWFGIPSIKWWRYLGKYKYGHPIWYIYSPPPRWETGLMKIHEEPDTFEHEEGVIDCVRETWEGETADGMNKTVELLRARQPVTLFRTIKRLDRDVAIGPDILSITMRIQGDDSLFESELKLISTSEVFEIAGKRVNCHRETGSVKTVNEETDRFEIFERWISKEVPTRDVKVVREVTLKGRTFNSAHEVVKFTTPEPAPAEARMSLDHPAWGGASRGAYVKFDVEEQWNPNRIAENFDYIERLDDIYGEGESGSLLVTETNSSTRGLLNRNFISSECEFINHTGMRLRDIRPELINAIGQFVLTDREEWVTLNNDMEIILWRSSEHHYFKRQVMFRNYSIILESDVVRAMLVSHHEPAATLRRRINREKVRRHVNENEFECIEELQWAEVDGKTSSTTRMLLTPRIPGGVASKNIIWDDEEKGSYTNYRAVDFDWGGEE